MESEESLSFTGDFSQFKRFQRVAKMAYFAFTVCPVLPLRYLSINNMNKLHPTQLLAIVTFKCVLTMSITIKRAIN